MKNEIQIFNNPQFGNVRVTTNEHNEPMFCAADVCHILGFSNPRNAVKHHVHEEDVDKIYTLTNGGNQLLTYVNESGLYALIFGSRLEAAKSFKKWVSSEVLPSIRKTGGYIVSKPDDTNEEILARAVLVAQATIDKKDRQIEMQQWTIRQQEEKIEADAPKVAFVDAISSVKGSCHFSDYAKLLGRNGVRIGQNRLFQWMREHGYIGKSGCHRNKPVQYYMNMGVLDLDMQTYHVDGEARLSFTPKITPKGMRYFFDKLVKEKEFFPRLDFGMM